MRRIALGNHLPPLQLELGNHILPLAAEWGKKGDECGEHLRPALNWNNPQSILKVEEDDGGGPFALVRKY